MERVSKTILKSYLWTLESINCYIEQSEISNIKSKKLE